MIDTVENIWKRGGARWQREIGPIGLILAVWTVLCWDLLSGQSVCAFRDSQYLFYPLFGWIDAVWQGGEWPLWNPWDGGGLPVVADGSSSVFYPAKLVFLLRGCDFPTRYGIYLACHLLGAALAAYALARICRCRPAGAALAGLAYGFGGPVLSQVNNVIYLVGAAWLPFTLMMFVLVGRRRSWWWIWGGGVGIAMMVLGGDPQMAVHAAALGAILLMWGPAGAARSPRNKVRFLLHRTAAIAVPWATVLLVAVGLAAIQWMPSWEWGQFSFRRIYDQPRSIYEVGEYLGREDADWQGVAKGLGGVPAAGTHHAELYQFSLPPWNLVELVWPHALGRMYPVHRRWANGLPGADRVWFPTLYLGGAVFLLALLGLRWRGSDRQAVVWSWMGWVFLLAAWGWYGFGWWLRECSGGALAGNVGPPVGGMYWLWVVGVPKYVMFRYPAKLFIVTTLMICLLAARGWDRVSRRRKELRKAIMGASLIALISLLMVAFLALAGMEQVLGRLATETVFGPLDVKGALNDLIASGIQAAGVFLLLAFLFYLMSRPRRAWGKRSGGIVGSLAITGLLAIDLLLANGWVMAKIPSRWVVDPAPQSFATRPSSDGFPTEWVGAEQGEWPLPANRLIQLVWLDRATAAPKWHLAVPVRHPESFGSLESVWDSPAASGKQPEEAREGRPGGNRISVLSDFQPPVEPVIYRGRWNAQRTPPVERGPLPNVAVTDFGLRSLSLSAEGIAEPVWLQISERWAPGWSAQLTTNEGAQVSVPVHCSPEGYRVIAVPAGTWTLEMIYSPRSGWGGLVLSVATLLAGCFGSLYRLRVPSREQTPRPER